MLLLADRLQTLRMPYTPRNRRGRGENSGFAWAARSSDPVAVSFAANAAARPTLPIIAEGRNCGEKAEHDPPNPCPADFELRWTRQKSNLVWNAREMRRFQDLVPSRTPSRTPSGRCGSRQGVGTTYGERGNGMVPSKIFLIFREGLNLLGHRRASRVARGQAPIGCGCRQRGWRSCPPLGHVVDGETLGLIRTGGWDGNASAAGERRG